MRNKLIIPVALLLWINASFAQTKTGDSTINNLKLDDSYIPGEYGAIPQYVKKGSGKQTLILIPGLGFDASVFDDLIKANEKNYTMYAITIPGYGNTHAAAMPATDTSYGLQYWNRGIEEGIIKLIDKNNLHRPIIAGHFTQGTQLALQLAIDHPDKIGGVIILGGPAKFIAIINGEPKEFDLKSTIAYVDKITASQWFKPITKNSFDAGNYLPEIYSLHEDTAQKLWDMVASVPLPVMIRYACEFFASDVTQEFEKIQCPVLVLRPQFNDTVLNKSINNYVQPQFINSWNNAAQKNSRITIKGIPASAAFVWKDNPVKTYEEIENFIESVKK